MTTYTDTVEVAQAAMIGLDTREIPLCMEFRSSRHESCACGGNDWDGLVPAVGETEMCIQNFALHYAASQRRRRHSVVRWGIPVR